MTNRELFFKHLGLPSYSPLGLEISRAEGVWLYDPAGIAYMDLVSGISVSNTGHRHPKVLAALRDQMDKYLYVNVYGEFIQSPQVELATTLASLLPESLNCIYFVNSGSEAIEGALKLAKRFTGRREVVAFENGYHGSTQGALAVLGNEELKNPFRPLAPGTRFLRFNRPEDLRQITPQTACVVAETIQAEAGLIFPEEGFLERLRKRCTETGALLIIDDVQMGLGRTGRMFSFEHWGISPDILVLAKALGGGMPLGAFIASREIMSTLTHDPELGHITTFGGHPMSCAAALASLKVIMEERLADLAEEKGMRFECVLSVHPAVKEFRRKGLVMGADLNAPGKRKLFSEACLREHLVIDWFLFSPATFRIAPPLTISDEEIELATDKLTKALDAIS